MENQPNIEQEIAQLEKQLAEKRLRQLADLGSDDTGSGEMPAEKEILREMVGERIQRHASQYQPAPQVSQLTPIKPQQDDAALSYVLPELKDKVQELVNLVFNKGLDDGIKEVVRSNNPALIDAFHDVLVDELYSMLVERKKIEQVE